MVVFNVDITERELSHVTSYLAGSNPAEAIGFLMSVKNPQHTFLRRGSKRICPMSQLCGM
jgi:hypothetical protein